VVTGAEDIRQCQEGGDEVVGRVLGGLHECPVGVRPADELALGAVGEPAEVIA